MLLREAVRDRQRRVQSAHLFDHRQPLLLVHSVTGDQEGEEVLHALVFRHVIEAGSQYAAGGFCGDVSQHIGRHVAGGIDMTHIKRHAVGVNRHRCQTGREDMARVHSTQNCINYRIFR